MTAARLAAANRVAAAARLLLTELAGRPVDRLLAVDALREALAAWEGK